MYPCGCILSHRFDERGHLACPCVCHRAPSFTADEMAHLAALRARIVAGQYADDLAPEEVRRVQ